MTRLNGKIDEPAPTPRRRLATVRDACKYGYFSHSKAYDLINRGKIKALKLDSKTLIDLDSIDELHASLPRIKCKSPA